MKIYSESGEMLTSPDLEKGWLESTQRVKTHHPEESGAAAVTHDELMAGTDDLHHLVVDKPAVPAREAWDEYETVQIWHPFTPEQLAQREAKQTYEQRLATLEQAVLEGGTR